jgi:hypothetical protein
MFLTLWYLWSGARAICLFSFWGSRNFHCEDSRRLIEEGQGLVFPFVAAFALSFMSFGKHF